jgi:single-strand DNA-binding protein
MKSLNQVRLIGHLGSDPEARNYDNDKVMSNFSVATGEERQDKNTNGKREYTEWHRIVCFNKLAEIANAHLKKGARVYVIGKLKTSKWRDKNVGIRHFTEIIADELILLDDKPVA